MPAGVMFTASVNDAQLVAKIQEMSRATGRTVAEQTRATMKALVKYVLTYTPPASAKAQGKQAQTAGEVAIVRDMKKLFYAVELKGERVEQYPDPHALHRQAFQGIGGLKTPPKVRYHVDRAKLSALKTTLQHNVGLLASGWAPAANTLGVPVPSWIQRWSGSGRGTDLITSQQETKVFLKTTNHIPAEASAISAQLQRLVESAKRAQVNSMKRQLPFILNRALARH
jgi:hypothetical protein